MAAIPGFDKISHRRLNDKEVSSEKEAKDKGMCMWLGIKIVTGVD